MVLSMIVNLQLKKGIRFIHSTHLAKKSSTHLQFNLKNTAKELAKIVHPRYSSRMKYFFKIKKYPPTNMFIRARLIN